MGNPAATEIYCCLLLKPQTMKDYVRILVRIFLLLAILFLVTRLFRRADENAIESPPECVYTAGNAPDSVRVQVTGRLREFRDGYALRDPAKVESFMESLYSRDNILILGTMPNEVYSGFDRATRLVRSDWESWGDCRFDTDSVFISSSGNTAWFATKGYVRFDMSRFLVLPLRLTGVMVNEGGVWKFTQQQFQFDLDFSFALLATVIISGWILVSVIALIVKFVKKHSSSVP